jgi:hypothetical protein
MHDDIKHIRVRNGVITAFNYYERNIERCSFFFTNTYKQKKNNLSSFTQFLLNIGSLRFTVKIATSF